MSSSQFLTRFQQSKIDMIARLKSMDQVQAVECTNQLKRTKRTWQAWIEVQPEEQARQSKEMSMRAATRPTTPRRTGHMTMKLSRIKYSLELIIVWRRRRSRRESTHYLWNNNRIRYLKESASLTSTREPIRHPSILMLCLSAIENEILWDRYKVVELLQALEEQQSTRMATINSICREIVGSQPQIVTRLLVL